MRIPGVGWLMIYVGGSRRESSRRPPVSPHCALRSSCALLLSHRSLTGQSHERLLDALAMGAFTQVVADGECPRPAACLTTKRPPRPLSERAPFCIVRRRFLPMGGDDRIRTGDQGYADPCRNRVAIWSRRREPLGQIEIRPREFLPPQAGQPARRLFTGTSPAPRWLCHARQPIVPLSG
jgi:hypothetical protein